MYTYITVNSLREPGYEEILAFCAEDPVERVFLEDVARRGIGRFTGLDGDGRLLALCHAMAVWLGRWAAMEVASYLGHRVLPPGPPPNEGLRRPGWMPLRRG